MLFDNNFITFLATSSAPTFLRSHWVICLNLVDILKPIFVCIIKATSEEVSWLLLMEFHTLSDFFFNFVFIIIDPKLISGCKQRRWRNFVSCNNHETISHWAVLIFLSHRILNWIVKRFNVSPIFQNVSKGVKPIKNVKYSVVFITDHASLMRLKLRTQVIFKKVRHSTQFTFSLIPSQTKNGKIFCNDRFFCKVSVTLLHNELFPLTH